MVRYIAVQQQAAEFRDETAITLATGGTPAHWLDQTSEDIGNDRGLIFPETSAQRVMRNRIPGQIAISGDIQVPFYSKGTPTMIYYALGKSDITTNAESRSGINNHTITADFENAPPTFEMEIGKDLMAHQYKGCCIKTMTMDFDPSESLLVTFGIMARIELASVTVKNLPSDFGDYNEKERVVSGTEMEVKTGINGATASAENSLESATIEMDNGFIDDNFVIGSRYVPEKYVQNHTVSGSLEFGYDDYAKYENVIDEDFMEVIFESKGEQVDKALAAKRKVKVSLPQIALMTVNLPTEGTDRYILSTDYQGERKAGSDNLLIVEVTNQENTAQLEK